MRSKVQPGDTKAAADVLGAKQRLRISTIARKAEVKEEVRSEPEEIELGLLDLARPSGVIG